MMEITRHLTDAEWQELEHLWDVEAGDRITKQQFLRARELEGIDMPTALRRWKNRSFTLVGDCIAE